MAASSVSNSLLGLLIFLFLGALSADPSSPSFSFNRFDLDESAISLFGGSTVVNGGSAIELSGQAVYEEPIRVVQGNPQRLSSFSTNFTFSIPGGGEGFALAMAPGEAASNLSGNGRFGLGKSRTSDGFLAVEFDASDNLVAIDTGSLESSNAPSLNLVLNSGRTLQCWIDYDAGSRRLEVRLAELGGSRPPVPFLARWVDLWKMWKDRDVFMGLSSDQSCLIHSWSFELVLFPHWIHSQPVDPDPVSNDDTVRMRIRREKNDRLLRVLAAMIFGIGGGALGAFCILYLRRVFGNRRPVAPEELVGKEESLDCDCECVCKKVEVVAVVDKAVKDGR